MALSLKGQLMPDIEIITTLSQSSYPMTGIDPRAVPVRDNILTVIETREIEGKRYAYTGWMINNSGEWIFSLSITDKLARIYLEQNKTIPSYVLSAGEILIPLSIDLQKEMYGEFRIIATLKCSIGYD